MVTDATEIAHAQENRLFAALPAASQAMLLHAGSLRKLPAGFNLYLAEARNEYCYFPLLGIASVVMGTPEGASAEVTLIGKEGVTGLLQMLGPAAIPASCVVQLPLVALRVRRETLQEIFHDSPEARSRLLEFAQHELFALGQVAGCNLLHAAAGRLGRWLLMAQDRTGNSTLAFTQLYLAQMLGLERSTVSALAVSLQTQGSIDYTRGLITILDRRKLEINACSCYPALQRLYEGLYRTRQNES